MITILPLKLITCLITISVLQNAHARRCCVPASFKSLMDVTGGFQNAQGGTQFVDNRVQLYFDYTNRRTRTETNVTLPNGMHFVHTELAHFDQHVAYKIDGNRCTKNQINDSMQEQCIQAQSTLVSTGYIGSPKNHLRVQTWRYLIPENNVINYRVLTESEDGECVPVLQSEYGLLDGAYSAMTYVISDIHHYDTSTTMFDPPQNICYPV